MTFLLSSQNMPFTISLVLMLAMAILEGVTTLIGAGFSDLLDSILPDMDVDVDVDLDADLDADFHTPGLFTKLLGWLKVGEVPILMLVIVFLTSFGLIGLFCQSMSVRFLGHMLPGALASIPSFFATLPVVRMCGGVLARIIPKDETESVSEESFVGRVAVITLGQAECGKAAQARLNDEHGQAHYIMVEPDLPDACFEQGSVVLIVSHEGPVYKAIANPSAALTDQQPTN